MKTVLIVDGAYLSSYSRRVASPIDLLKFKEKLVSLNGGALHESYYLTSAHEHMHESQINFFSWLKSAPPRGPKFRLMRYPLKPVAEHCPACRHHYDRTVQQGVDVGLATLMIRLAVQGVYDRLILVAGDSDFEDAVAYVKADFKKEVWLVGSHDNLSVDLQSYADTVVWLEDIHGDVRKASEKAA